MPRFADVRNAVNEGVNPVNEKISSINEKLAAITAILTVEKPDAAKSIPKVMEQSLREKANPDLGLRTVDALARRAKEQSIVADPASIAEIGQQLMSNPDNFRHGVSAVAWDAVVSLVDYRSFLNAASAQSQFVGTPVAAQVPSAPTTVHHESFSFAIVSSDRVLYPEDFVDKPYEFVLGPFVPLEKTAISELIGHPSIQHASLGHEFIVFDYRGHFLIDGFHLKHVVLRNGQVVYRGGPLILEDVHFVNCTFEIQSTTAGRDLSSAVLASEAVNLDRRSSAVLFLAESAREVAPKIQMVGRGRSNLCA
jgi:hypothetical protein